MNLKKVIEIMKTRGHSSTITNKIAAVAGQFATEDAFFMASKGDLMKAYSKIAGAKGYSLGNTFFKAFDVALSLHKEPDQEEENVVVPELCGEWLNESVTLENMRGIADFMELFKIKQLPIGKMLTLLDLIRDGSEEHEATDESDKECVK